MSTGFLFRGLLFFIICAIQSIESKDGRFCGEVAWTKACSSVSDDDMRRRKRDSDSDLNKDISEEANKNPSFTGAWKMADKDVKLPALIKKYKILRRSEIKLIMAYTYELNQMVAQFYASLNEDCRNFGLNGGNYPKTKKILRNALIKLGDSQTNLPPMLYRKEPDFLLKSYTSWKNQQISRQLLMFTSTSKSKNAFPCNPQGKMQTIFKTPQAGASIADFSGFPGEQEFVIPLMYGTFYVETVDSQKKEAVLVGPTTSSAQALVSNSIPCNDGNGHEYLHVNFELFTLCLVITFKKRINC
ncbi:hypothetical protein SNE40_004148 [Patella caerulea]|uniref:NAD(P)(+)--arginine ADP-ribosyltransferase n=1 Tax=Patella caerulea TaxID=87958 RepID=A0AAN8Q1K3_PATCE